MSIQGILRRARLLWPDKLAVKEGELELSYSQLSDRAHLLAAGLRSLGAGPGATVAALAPNVHELIEAYFACALAGARCCPVNYRLAAPEVALILDHSRSQILLAHRDLRDTVCGALRACRATKAVVWIGEPTPDVEWHGVDHGYDELLQRSKPLAGAATSESDDVAHLYYTSGTTGAPKGVMLTHGNVTCHALSSIAELKLTDTDVWLHAAPMFHLADAWATFAVTWVGGAHVCLPAFDPGLALDTLATAQVTLTNLIPTMLGAMAQHPRAEQSFPALRMILSGGAPIAPEVVRKVVDVFGCEYVQTYGMTETSPYLTMSLLKAAQLDLPEQEQLRIRSRTGRPILGVDLRVVDAQGADVAQDDHQVGEIIVRGPTVTPGYWDNPQATSEAIIDGWLHTGDLAVMDSEGSVNIVDRKKDMIITGGENVYSTEVENRLYEHPDVVESAVFGLPDTKWGEAVCAAVVLRSGSKAKGEDLQAFCRTVLAGFKTPKRLFVLDALPKTGSGKISKKLLRDRLRLT